MTTKNETKKSVGRPAVYTPAQCVVLALFSLLYGIGGTMSVMRSKNGTKLGAMRTFPFLNGTKKTNLASQFAKEANISLPTLALIRDNYLKSNPDAVLVAPGKGRPSFAAVQAWNDLVDKHFEKTKNVKAKVVKAKKTEPAVVSDVPAVETPVVNETPVETAVAA